MHIILQIKDFVKPHRPQTIPPVLSTIKVHPEMIHFAFHEITRSFGAAF